MSESDDFHLLKNKVTERYISVSKGEQGYAGNPGPPGEKGPTVQNNIFCLL